METNDQAPELLTTDTVDRIRRAARMILGMEQKTSRTEHATSFTTPLHIDASGLTPLHEATITQSGGTLSVTYLPVGEQEPYAVFTISNLLETGEADPEEVEGSEDKGQAVARNLEERLGAEMLMRGTEPHPHIGPIPGLPEL